MKSVSNFTILKLMEKRRQRFPGSLYLSIFRLKTIEGIRKDTYLLASTIIVTVYESQSIVELKFSMWRIVIFFIGRLSSFQPIGVPAWEIFPFLSRAPEFWECVKSYCSWALLFAKSHFARSWPSTRYRTRKFSLKSSSVLLVAIRPCRSITGTV